MHVNSICHYIEPSYTTAVIVSCTVVSGPCIGAFIIHAATLYQKIDKGLTIKDLDTVNSALHTAADVWSILGLRLRVYPDRLDEISSCKNGDKDNMCAMLKHWLQTSPSRTWTDICNALRDELVARNVLADAIEREYCSGGNNSLYINCAEVYSCCPYR